MTSECSLNLKGEGIANKSILTNQLRHSYNLDSCLASVNEVRALLTLQIADDRNTFCVCIVTMHDTFSQFNLSSFVEIKLTCKIEHSFETPFNAFESVH